MSQFPSRGLRVHALAAATSLVLASTLLAAPAHAGRANLSGLQSAEEHDQFVVKYRDGSQARGGGAARKSLLDAAARAVPARAGRKLGVGHLRRMAVGADVVRADRKLDRAEAETLMRQLAADPQVEYVEVDGVNEALLSPNDSRYDEQWGYSGTYGIKAEQAWDVSNGAGVVVAVLDTGITSHTDLNDNVLAGYDFVSNVDRAQDGNGRDGSALDPGDWAPALTCSPSQFFDKDSSWHGTHVAGTVAAETGNYSGVAGTAFGAKVVPVRVLGRCGGDESDIADAIVWASGGSVEGVPANANPAEVINLSLGGPNACPQFMQDAINVAVGNGATVVVAAGNNNVDASTRTPASCANVITVGASDSDGKRSIWSTSQQSGFGEIVDVAAPGSDILSTLNTGTTTPGSRTYASYNGTSMATPHVAGIVALIQSVAAVPKTPAQIEALLKSTATPFPSTPDKPVGTGIANAFAAVDVVNREVSTHTNTTDYAINNYSTVNSPLAVSRAGRASGSAQVSVTIIHPDQGDLKVDLVAPDGTYYNIHNRTGGTADNVIKTVTLNLSAERRDGTWNLRVNDNRSGTTGRIDRWSITF